jgi:glycosyltransferase involved in cell wall biosynthesis
MHLLQIASGNFFSTYGGGQVYVRNIVDEMVRQGEITLTIISFVETDGISEKEYRGCKLYECEELDDEQMLSLIKEIHPDVIHAHSHKGQACRIGATLDIPVVVTSHHGGIVCPAGTLLNCKDEICQTTVSHQNCLKCCLRNIRTGLYWYPFMHLIPEKTYLKLGQWLQKKPFIPFITPIGDTALSIQNKQEEWQNIIHNCTLMIAPSEAMKEAMVRNGLDAKIVKVIPHGIPLPSHPAPFPSTTNGIRFFYIGRICYVKGLHILLEAFHRLNDDQAELHLIGGTANKGERRYEARLRRKYQNDNRIVWHGKVAPNEVYDAIKDYHVSSSSAYLEAFGLNIAESLAMGKPVLATRCGGAEMQIEDGVNGWLVPTNNVEALRQKMEEIVHMSEEQLAQMAGKKKVVSIEEHCIELIKLYNTVYEKHNLSK